MDCPNGRPTAGDGSVFGQMVPVKNFDLWQRMERALRFHQVGVLPAAVSTNPIGGPAAKAHR